MARQRREQRMTKGMFGSKPDASDQRNYMRQNAMVDDAEALMGALPKRFQDAPGSREIADALVTAKYLPTDQRAQLAAAGLGVAGLGAGALGAYSDLRSEYAPAGPLDVAGRMVNNFIPGGNASVGADPLAAARNNVAAAASLVGTEEVLGALAADQIKEMRGINQAAMTPVEFEQMTAVQAMIDDRAQELMQQPIQKSDGSVTPMGYDTAQRIATEQINMELRANQAY